MELQINNLDDVDDTNLYCEYYENGQIKEVCKIYDEYDEYKKYYENGHIQFIYMCIKNNIYVKYYEYYDNLKLRLVEHININKKLNTRKSKYMEYYENGQLKKLCNYANGIKDGFNIEYCENGQIKIICNYKDNKEEIITTVVNNCMIL